MSIIRTKRSNNFTVVDNDVFKAGGLSWDARGLLCTLLSKPDDWHVIVKALEKETEGTRKHTKERGLWEIFKELVEAGYVVRKKRQSGEMDYYVYDTPQPDKTAVCENRSLRKPQTAKTADCEKSSVLQRTETTYQELKKDKQELICDPSCDFASETAAADSVADDFRLPENSVGADAETLPAGKPKKPDPRSNPDNVKTWEAYARAYRARYGVLPMSNAKVRGQVAQFVKTVGAELAPVLAAYYPSHNKQYFVQRRHDFGALLHDYQQVATDYQIGQQMTGVQAAQTEKTQANRSSHDEALAILRAKGLA